MKSNKTNGKTWGCLGLFALPFAGVGVFMIGLIGAKLAEWAAMQSWHETPAKILSAELELHDDSDDGTTYRAVAEYEYEFAGAAYRSKRVALHGGSDNIGSYQRRIGSELVKHANSGEPFRCFFDPSQPDQSVLYRDLRFEMIAFYDVFAVVFGGVGFGLLLGSLYARPIARREEELQSQFPHEPWKWKSDWIDGRIPASQKTFLALALTAAWWNFVSLPTTLLLPLEIANQNYWALVALPAACRGATTSLFDLEDMDTRATLWPVNTPTRRNSRSHRRPTSWSSANPTTRRTVGRIPSETDLRRDCEVRRRGNNPNRVG